jgi:signal transduction histidine kinase
MRKSLTQPPDMQELYHFAEFGRLSASLIHEISNPLTAAWLHLEQPGDSQTQAIRQAKHSISTLRRYVDAARQQLKRESPAGIFELGPQITQLRRVLAPLARQARVQLEFDRVPACRLFGDKVKFQQIVSNLIINAIEAYDTDLSQSLGRPVRISFKLQAKHLSITVRDYGKGISFSELRRIFEPFYTTKQQRGLGLGIGLSIVRDYVTTGFGGSITVNSSRRAGTRFTVKLPIHL